MPVGFLKSMRLCSEHETLTATILWPSKKQFLYLNANIGSAYILWRVKGCLPILWSIEGYTLVPLWLVPLLWLHMGSMEIHHPMWMQRSQYFSSILSYDHKICNWNGPYINYSYIFLGTSQPEASKEHLSLMTYLRQWKLAFHWDSGRKGIQKIESWWCWCPAHSVMLSEMCVCVCLDGQGVVHCTS